jgi:hypothetical protein
MGKKKGNRQNHLQQSMGSMVSRAALTQMGPAIEQYVKRLVQQLGSQLAVQQASTLETLFARTIVLETIVMEKFGFTTEELAVRVSNVEDEKEDLELVNGPVELNDVVRVEVRTKTKDQPEFQGSSRLKIYKTGTGETIGSEMEEGILGMVAGETKEIEFGKDKELTAELTVNRVSRSTKKPEETKTETETPAEASNEDQSKE